MAKAVELQPAALAEAEAAAAWYAERDPRVASAFVAEIEAALARIAEAPGRWPAHLHGTQRVRLTRFPYLVVYRDEQSAFSWWLWRTPGGDRVTGGRGEAPRSWALHLTAASEAHAPAGECRSRWADVEPEGA